MNTNWTNRFSNIAQRTHPPQISWLMAQALEVPGLISLAAGFVDQSSLPHSQVGENLAGILEKIDDLQSPLQYGTTAGDVELRRLLLERLKREDGLPLHLPYEDANVIIGSGSQQILYLAFETLLNEGDIVLMEAPTYFVVLGIMQARGAETVGIDTDEFGLIPEALAEALERLQKEDQLHRVKMLYLMTYTTNPQGIQLSLERRKQILEILSRYKEKGYPILLLEDAAYRHLSFEPNTKPAMLSMQQDDELVLYIESFSKSLSPGLRMGYGIGPQALIQKMIDLKGSHDFGSSNLSQQIVKALIMSGELDLHTDTLRKVYKQKWHLVDEILKEHAPPEAKWIEPKGGFYTWLQLPDEINTNGDSELFQEALKQKVLYVPGNLCYSPDREEAKRSSSMRLAFGMINEEKLREGCKRLMTAVSNVVDRLVTS